jgi:hypothetical protein
MSEEEIPRFTEEFKTSIVDFIKDLQTTFPEHVDKLEKWLKCDDNEFQSLFEHCLKVYPERFFDILNKNKELFSEESTINVDFLPGLSFKLLFNSTGVSENIQETIWKYLQVILLILVRSLQNKVNFGDAMNMFDKIDMTELQTQLSDTMKNISSLFDNFEEKTENNEENDKTDGEDDESENKNPFSKIPKIDELKDHLQSLFDGKIGKLAKELAEDMSNDFVEAFGQDLNGVNSTKDVLNAFMKNPQKMGNVVNTVKDKLADKMKSGDITKEDLVSEASEMMSKMQGLGDMGVMGDMLKKMAKSMGVNIPKGAKMDTSALNNMQKKSTMKERLKGRAMAKKQAEVVKKMEEEVERLKRQQAYEKFMKENPEFNPENPLFSLDDKQEKSGLQAPMQTPSQKKRNKKKAKKVKEEEAKS